MGADERLSRPVPRRLFDSFEKMYLPGAPLRNRTVDLLLTISTVRSSGRFSCTDTTHERTDGTDRAGSFPAPSPRPGPRWSCSSRQCPLPDVAIGRSSPGAIADQWRTAGGDCHGRRQRDRHVRTPEEECDGRYQRAVARQDPGRARGPPAALRAITGTRRGCLAPIPRAGNPAP
jgi:hypothetical protein